MQISMQMLKHRGHRMKHSSNLTHKYDLTLTIGSDLPAMAASMAFEEEEEEKEVVINIDSLGTVGTFGSAGGCFGTIGTAGCCC